jgi:hypothetical protein
MNKIGKRISISASEIRIASPKNIFILLFLPIWLIGWSIGGATAIRIVISGQSKETWFLLIWLCGWLAGELFVLYAFLWGVFGHEVITTEQGIMIIKRSIFGYGPLKKYEIVKMSKLRAAGFFITTMNWDYNIAYWGLSGGTVAFDYDGKTKRFGINLNEDDANQLVAIMKSRFNV